MRLVVLLLFMALSTSLFAHEDTVINVIGRQLVEIPPKYQLATFEKETYRLQVKNRMTVFPQCAIDYLAIEQGDEMEIVASWYHSTETLPDYIAFVNRRLDRTVLVDLETLNPISVGWGFGRSQEEQLCLGRFEVSGT